jgi:hypothetical protein
MLSELDQKLVNAAISIVNKAKENNITLRILGALGIYINVLKDEELINKMKSIGRIGDVNLFTDVDLIGYSNERKKIREFFEKELKFYPDFYVNRLFGDRRLIFYDRHNNIKVDIFFDKLEFSHTINLKGRLELSFPTLALEDLILEKLQIHEINRKDLVDLAILLLKYNVKDGKQDNCIDGSYIARILAEDWGFWYDAVNNLKKLEVFVNKLHEEKKLEDFEKSKILSEINNLLTIIDRTEKTKKWIERSKIGTSKKWYREVEEIER